MTSFKDLDFVVPSSYRESDRYLFCLSVKAGSKTRGDQALEPEKSRGSSHEGAFPIPSIFW